MGKLLLVLVVAGKQFVRTSSGALLKTRLVVQSQRKGNRLQSIAEQMYLTAGCMEVAIISWDQYKF